MTTLWDTTGTEIVEALTVARRTGGALFSGMALTLVVVADERRVPEAEQAAATAAARHPCRLLVVVRRLPDAHAPRLDAEVLTGGRLGPAEAVIMRMYGPLGRHAESVVMPLLAADAPVVTWWQGPPPPRLASDPLAALADRRITDCLQAPDPLIALRQRAEDYAPGDTDLTWTRSTPWRATLTATLDSLAADRNQPIRPLGGLVEGDPRHPTAALLAGWLSARCGCPITVADPGTPPPAHSGVHAINIQLDADQQVRIHAAGHGHAVITASGRPAATATLPDPALGDLLAEELHHLDADEPYRQALQTATGHTGLPGHSPARRHTCR